MTEDDTFLKLKKLPLMDMYTQWMESPIRPPDNINAPDLEVIRFFEKYGWSYTVWIDTWKSSHRER